MISFSAKLSWVLFDVVKIRKYSEWSYSTTEGKTSPSQNALKQPPFCFSVRYQTPQGKVAAISDC